jgi:DNA polymerase-3 subunit delta'
MSDDEKSWPSPRANPDLLGHEAAEKTLLESFRSGRLPHAWLICGPQGIGKATLAFRFARFLLSAESGPSLFGGADETLVRAPESAIFKHVASGGHADLMTVEISPDPKSGKMRSEIVVDDVRAVGSFLHMTPAEGGYRVVVVDAVDQMNRNAANALLKILEEPPPQAVLLLVCHAPGRVLPTIRSRCRKLVLRPLADSLVDRLLARYLPEVSADDRAALTRLAEGSPGRGLALAEAGGLDLYREMVALVGSPNMQGLQKFCERAARADDGFETVARLFLWWLARAIRLGAEHREPQGEEIVAGEGKALARVAGLDRSLELWEKAGRLFARAEAVNLDPKQVLMSAFLALENGRP